MTDPHDWVEVKIQAVPVGLWKVAAEHQESIQREFDIIRSAEPQDSIPNRLQQLIDELSAQYAQLGEANQRRLQDAAERGQSHIDLVYRVPPDVADAATRLLAMLDEVDAYCRAGEHLLSLATPDPAVALRRWLLGEFPRQVAGEPPLPWPDYVAAIGLTSEPHPDDGVPDHEVTGDSTAPVIAVTSDLDLATVASLRDTIQRLHNEGMDRLTLDLREVSFTDSVGISLLVATSNRLQRDGGRLVVLCGERLRSVLEIAGVVGLFEIRDS